MKGRKAQLVPLPPASVELIREAMTIAQAAWAVGDGPRPNDFPLFPSPRDPAKPILPGTVTHAFSPLVKALQIANVSPHDLRRTGSTILTSERLGVSHFIRSLVIAHTTDNGGGAAVSGKHYDANSYAAEKRKALTAWEDLLLEIVGVRQRSSNVATLVRGAA